MPLTDPRESLAYHAARPLVRARGLGHVPVARTTGQVRRFMGTDNEPGTLFEPPPATLGDFCRSLLFVVYQGEFGAGYGGPALGAIADCLCRFVDGDYSAEIMLDTIWTLSHNNGAIFNKQILAGGGRGAPIRYGADAALFGKRRRRGPSVPGNRGDPPTDRPLWPRS